MKKELLIALGIIIFVITLQAINFVMNPNLNLSQIVEITVFDFGSVHIGIVMASIYGCIFSFRWFIVKPIIWIFSASAIEDVEFVHTLFAQSNAKIKLYSYVLFIIIITFFSSSMYWSYWAEIDELARGEGKVIPSAKIQTIQSLDGGVISEILIKEGSFVKVGQPLMKIDTTRFKASLDENKNTLEDLLASRIRLEMEINIDIKKPIKNLYFNNKNLEKYPDIIKAQRNLFVTRVKELQSNIDTLNLQVEQKKQERIELESKLDQLGKEIILIKEELTTVEILVKRKARANIDLISIKREYNNILGDYNATRLSIPRSKWSIKESQNNIIEKIRKFKSAAAQEFQKVNSEIKRYESKIISEKDKLDKTIIISPVDGIIKQININTIGGVVRSGIDLIEIVPNSKILLVEAKINPKDIAFINPSQKAIVKITAYDFSIYGGLNGKIVEISADSILDKDSRDGTTFYKVVIQTDKNYLEKNGEKFSIIPGMIASVDIVTGKKSILDFILKPILKTKNSALHER